MRNFAVYINALPAEKTQWKVVDWFKYKLISGLLSADDGKNYRLLSDEQVKDFFPPKEEVEFVELGKYTPRKFSMNRHFNQKLSAAVKDLGDGTLISLPGVLPSNLKMRSCLLVSDEISTIEKPVQKRGFEHYRRKNLSRYLKKATQLFTLSNYTKQYLISNHQVEEERIQIIQRGISPLDGAQEWEEREDVKEK